MKCMSSGAGEGLRPRLVRARHSASAKVSALTVCLGRIRIFARALFLSGNDFELSRE